MMQRITSITIDMLDAVPIFMSSKGRPDPDSIHELKDMTEEEEYKWCWEREIRPADVLHVIFSNWITGETYNDELRFKRGLRAYYLKMRTEN
jgi:hypothetical protein